MVYGGPGLKAAREAKILEETARLASGEIKCEKVTPKLIKALRDATGKGNDVVVATQKEAEELLAKARPEIPWRYTYEAPSSYIGAELHPPDGSGLWLPHIKWRDWSGGKATGAEGHIYFGGVFFDFK
jgi:hypothetical protein